MLQDGTSRGMGYVAYAAVKQEGSLELLNDANFPTLRLDTVCVSLGSALTRSRCLIYNPSSRCFTMHPNASEE